MKHIDAPWRSIEARSDVFFSHTVIGRNSHIARVNQATRGVFTTQDELRKKEAARAQLLAAAPELLDKLKECSLFLEKERRKIDNVLEDVNELIAGEDFEPPPLKVNPDAIAAKVAFIEASKKENVNRSE
jgi:hypothetical protein